jgi:hypothetical protein
MFRNHRNQREFSECFFSAEAFHYILLKVCVLSAVKTYTMAAENSEVLWYSEDGIGQQSNQCSIPAYLNSVGHQFFTWSPRVWHRCWCRRNEAIKVAASKILYNRKFIVVHWMHARSSTGSTATSNKVCRVWWNRVHVHAQNSNIKLHSALWVYSKYSVHLGWKTQVDAQEKTFFRT